VSRKRLQRFWRVDQTVKKREKKTPRFVLGGEAIRFKCHRFKKNLWGVGTRTNSRKRLWERGKVWMSEKLRGVAANDKSENRNARRGAAA